MAHDFVGLEFLANSRMRELRAEAAHQALVDEVFRAARAPREASALVGGLATALRALAQHIDPTATPRAATVAARRWR